MISSPNSKTCVNHIKNNAKIMSIRIEYVKVFRKLTILILFLYFLFIMYQNHKRINTHWNHTESSQPLSTDLKWAISSFSIWLTWLRIYFCLPTAYFCAFSSAFIDFSSFIKSSWSFSSNISNPSLDSLLMNSSGSKTNYSITSSLIPLYWLISNCNGFCSKCFILGDYSYESLRGLRIKMFISSSFDS